MRKKSILRRLLPWILTLAVLAAIVIFIGIPIYSQTDESETEKPEVHQYSGDSKHLTLENDTVLFDLNPDDTTFSVTDRQTGKVWYSNPQDLYD